MRNSGSGWVKAKGLGETMVYEDMMAAAQHVNKASEYLIEALDELKKERP